ncbi:MAG TPA: flagellar protein [Desulfotomaculum sp.]|nr:flagellar protein [Desulfotomaculum sp.]
MAYIPDEKAKPQIKEQELTSGSFQVVLHQQLQQQENVKLSAHAQIRLAQRNIHLAEADWNKINNAVNLAQAKGVRDSLLLFHGLALIASIKNRTIVTALDKEAMVNHVFTNIDGAVIIK